MPCRIFATGRCRTTERRFSLSSTRWHRSYPRPRTAPRYSRSARGDVVADVWEAWATEGAIGLRLELSPGADWYQVSALLAELAASPGAYRLIIDEEGEMTARIRLMAGP